MSVYCGFNCAVFQICSFIVININAAVKRLEQDYDIVIVGIPGACLSFNPQYSNDFGITTQLFMCAIEPDYSVLMLPYMRYEEAFISHVKDEVQKRYDITINDIGISDVFFKIN